ncbi:MAG: AAA family ATPase [Deltaproteobacteria bacterium]|nr:AAA family ATPase [Deltaproteobacteria bacterium]
MAIHRFGEFELDNSLYELRRDEQILEIGPRVFDVLAYLIDHSDRLVSKDELIQRVWGATAMSSSSVPTCIAAVRKVLGDDPADPQYIETLRGRGYRFIAELVQHLDAAEAGGHSAVATPALAGDFGRSIFVERENELAALYAAFERTLSGTPQLVLVSGEPGIGKTRLLEEFALTTRDDGAVVLLGRAIEGEGAPAFWPWVQIVRTCVDFSDATTVPTALGPLASSLLTMVPELSEQLPNLPPPPKLDPDQARFRLFDAVAALLTRAASERPLVVLLDDLHRADTASTRLLQFATREIRDAPILFIGTYRDAELSAESSRTKTLSDLAREEPTRCIHLHGLTLDGVEKFVHHSAPQQRAASEALVTALYDQTGGNPFFLTQVVHLLAAEGRLDGYGTDTSWKVHLPGGIRDAVARQLDGLPTTTRQVLDVAAVAGREFESPVLASASDADPATTVAHLEPALQARIVSAVPGHVSRYRFAHVLLRDCIYDALPTLDRVHLHERIAVALETFHDGHLAPRAAELAYHYYEAIASAGVDRAIAYSLEAARWADSRLAYEDVPEHYRRALLLLEQQSPADPMEQGRLLITLGESEIRAGEREEAQETFKSAVTIARELSEPDLLAKAALGLAPGFFAIEVGVYDPVLVSLLEEALRELPPGDSAIRAQVIARLSVALGWSGQEDRRFRLSHEGVSMARRVDDSGTLARTLSARHESLWGGSDFQERQRTISEIKSLTPRTHDPEIQLMLCLLRITASLESGDVNSADRSIAEYRHLAAETRQPRYTWYTGLFQSMRALMSGDFDTASKAADQYRAIGELAKDANAFQSFGTHLAILGWEQGKAEELLPSVDRFIAQYPSVNAWRCVRMFLNTDISRLEKAKREFELFARADFQNILANPNRLVSLCLLAEICSSLGDTKRARLLYEILLPESGRFAIIGYSTSFFGSVDERLGMLASTLANYDLSKEHFEQALNSHSEIGATPWIARTHYHYGCMLSRSSSRSCGLAATSHLETADSIAGDLGMANLHQRISDRRFQTNGLLA